MANIPDSVVLPGAYSNVVTDSRGITVPANSRVAVLMGEGSSDQVIVSAALGSGKDGLNPNYTSTSGADGRHFQIQYFPLISNRTTIYKNGIPLNGLESLIDSNPFNNSFDYRLDITTGHLELQRAHLQNQGGSFFVPLTTNTGLGTLNALTLIDVNAPPEIWTVRCISVQRNSLNQPIAGTAKFLAFGSISGSQVDANGNPIVWVANNQVVSNGIISFSIKETVVNNVVTSPFTQGDAFTVIVVSGVLNRNDTLTVNCIPTFNLNSPVLVQGMKDVVTKYSYPSLTNNLSLGCQLAFDNAATSLITLQCAPPLPRRTSYELDSNGVNSLSSNNDDFIFPLPLNVTPDINSDIHFFTTNNVTQVETQILPNKFPYYTLNTPGNPTITQFITDNNPAPSGNSYAYTVIQESASIFTGFDGVMTEILVFIIEHYFLLHQ